MTAITKPVMRGVPPDDLDLLGHSLSRHNNDPSPTPTAVITSKTKSNKVNCSKRPSSKKSRKKSGNRSSHYEPCQMSCPREEDCRRLVPPLVALHWRMWPAGSSWTPQASERIRWDEPQMRTRMETRIQKGEDSRYSEGGDQILEHAFCALAVLWKSGKVSVNRRR